MAIRRGEKNRIAPFFTLLVLILLSLFGSLFSTLAATVNYDIVYVRQPRYGNNTNTTWPEVFHPARLDPGADLMLPHPNGSEEVLVAGGNGSVTDPFISFDGQWCYYVLFPDLRPSALNGQRGDLPYEGCDLYKLHLQTRQIVRLTFQEFTPNTSAGKWNPSRATNHIVMCVDGLAKPAIAWATLNILSAVDEPNQSRRLEVELPSGAPETLFLRLQKP